jgi:hypothetical protein
LVSQGWPLYTSFIVLIFRMIQINCFVGLSLNLPFFTKLFFPSGKGKVKNGFYKALNNLNNDKNVLETEYL